MIEVLCFAHVAEELAVRSYTVSAPQTIAALRALQALIPLALEGTDVGKVKAAHALAKIAAVSNPDIAFPGERVGGQG